MSSERDAVFDLERHLGAEMVPEVLADPGEMTNHGYAKLLQLVLGANTREHQQMRRSDRPGAQYYPVGLDVENLPTACGFDAGDLAVLDHNFPNEHFPPHRQIQIMAHRIEMRHRSAHPDAVQIIRRRHAEAGRVQPILVARRAEPRLQTGRMESLLYRRPRTGLTAPDGHRSVRAM